MHRQTFSVRGSGGHACAGEVLAVPPGRSPQGKALPPAAGDVPLLPGKQEGCFWFWFWFGFVLFCDVLVWPGFGSKPLRFWFGLVCSRSVFGWTLVPVHFVLQYTILILYLCCRFLDRRHRATAAPAYNISQHRTDQIPHFMIYTRYFVVDRSLICLICTIYGRQ